MYKIYKPNLQKGTYIDFRRVKKFTAKYPIRIVCGPRGDGKSTSGKKLLEDYVYKQNRKFVWICRTEDEIKVKKHDIFDEQFPNWKIIGNRIFDISTEEVVDKKGNKRKKVIDEFQVGMIIPLNLASKYRSGASFKDYDVVYWDEFQDEHGRYLQDEMKKLFSILETILRTKKNADIWLISNEVDQFCPLFEYIKLEQQPNPNEIFFYPELKIAYYRPKTSAELRQLKEQSIMGHFSRNSEYKKFAYDNEWLIDNSSQIITKPLTTKEKFNLVFQGVKFGLYQIPQGLWLSYDLNGGKIYPLSKPDALENGLEYRAPDWFYNIITSAMRNNTLYFAAGSLKMVIGSFVGK